MTNVKNHPETRTAAKQAEPVQAVATFLNHVRQLHDDDGVKKHQAYQRLCIDVAAGQLANPGAVLGTLAAAGKTVDDLVSDVRTRQRRQSLFEAVRAYDPDEKDDARRSAAKHAADKARDEMVLLISSSDSRRLATIQSEIYRIGAEHGRAETQAADARGAARQISSGGQDHVIDQMNAPTIKARMVAEKVALAEALDAELQEIERQLAGLVEEERRILDGSLSL